MAPFVSSRWVPLRFFPNRFTIIPRGRGGGAPPPPTPFIFAMETTTAGQAITLPCRNKGIFNAVVDWGDGTPTSTVTAYNAAALTHTYAAAGVHTLSVTGQFPNIYFSGSADAPLLRSVTQLGDVGWIDLYRAFAGCTGLTSFGGVASTSLVTSMALMFYGCSGMTTCDITALDTSAATTLAQMFRGCAALTTVDLSAAVTSAVTDMSLMFFQCSALSSVNLTGLDTSAVSTFGSMFRSCPSLLALDLSGFSLAGITATSALTNLALGTNMGTAGYDATLVAWDAQAPLAGLTPHFGTSQYTLAGAAGAAHADLIGTYGWTIHDGGGV